MSGRDRSQLGRDMPDGELSLSERGLKTSSERLTPPTFPKGEGKGRIQQMLYKDEWGRYGESGVMFCLWQSDMLLTACDML